jgi:hypothetical protein
MNYKKGMQELIKAKWRQDHRPATDGQARVLGRYGLNPTLFNKNTASKAIDKVKEYGWKLSYEQRQEIQNKFGNRKPDRQAPNQSGELFHTSE